MNLATGDSWTRKYNSTLCCSVPDSKFSSFDSIYGKMLIIRENNSDTVTMEVYGPEFQREKCKDCIIVKAHEIKLIHYLSCKDS